MERVGEKHRPTSRRERVSCFGKVADERRAQNGTCSKKCGAVGCCSQRELVRLPNHKVVDRLVVAPLLVDAASHRQALIKQSGGRNALALLVSCRQKWRARREDLN